MAHSRFYDSVLQELAAGKLQDGISMLFGMLDAVDQRPEQFGAACDELRGHALAAMLREDPLFAASPSSPGNDSARLRLITLREISADVSQTGRHLFAITSELKLCRALRERHLEAGRRVARAWQHGRRICVLGGGPLFAARMLAGHDLSNITVVDDDRCTGAKLRDDFGTSFQLIEASPAQFLRVAGGVDPFNVICTSDLADSNAAHGLAALMPALRRQLAPGGRIELAALDAHHPGRGWRRAYLDWEPCCHEAGSFAAIATAARLTASVYHDETACVVWCEMGAIEGREPGEGNHGQARRGMS